MPTDWLHTREDFARLEWMVSIGVVLWKLGESVKTQQIFEILRLDIEQSNKGPIYCCLGMMIYEPGEYAKAIAYHEKSKKSRFLAIIRIWLSPTTISVMCTEAWMTIRKHYRLSKMCDKRLKHSISLQLTYFIERGRIMSIISPEISLVEIKFRSDVSRSSF